MVSLSSTPADIIESNIKHLKKKSDQKNDHVGLATKDDRKASPGVIDCYFHLIRDKYSNIEFNAKKLFAVTQVASFNASNHELLKHNFQQ